MKIVGYSGGFGKGFFCFVFLERGFFRVFGFGNLFFFFVFCWIIVRFIKYKKIFILVRR